MAERCQWVHQELECLPRVNAAFKVERLPEDGIYFLYEEGELWGHGGNKPRIVRVGINRGNGNFQSRIAEHFLLDDSKMSFDVTKPAPHERSIFRKNLGRALLNRANDPYLKVWEYNFTSKDNREQFGKLRDLEHERAVELEVTGLLRDRFSFRFVLVQEREEREELECALIGTIAHCGFCKPSAQWLGNFSPKAEIRQSGLWLVQHLGSAGFCGQGAEKKFKEAIRRTRVWVQEQLVV